MNVYERFELGQGKSLFVFVCLANKSSSSISLGSPVKKAKLKYNNMFLNKLVNMCKFNLTIYNIIFYVYLSKNILI